MRRQARTSAANLGPNLPVSLLGLGSSCAERRQDDSQGRSPKTAFSSNLFRCCSYPRLSCGPHPSDGAGLLGAVVMLRYALTARRDRNHTGGSYWSATPVLFPNFYNAVLPSGYRKDNISVMHNDRFRGSLVDFQRQRSSQLTGGDFGWPGCLDGKGQAIRA